MKKFYRETIDFSKLKFNTKRSVRKTLPPLTKGSAFIKVTWSWVLGIQMPAPDVSIELYKGRQRVKKGVTALTVSIKKPGNDYYFILKPLKGFPKNKWIDVSTTFPSAHEIETRKIPVSFFSYAFDSFWNDVQPLQISLDEKIKLILKDELKVSDHFQDRTQYLGRIPIPIDTNMVIGDWLLKQCAEEISKKKRESKPRSGGLVSGIKDFGQSLYHSAKDFLKYKAKWLGRKLGDLIKEMPDLIRDGFLNVGIHDFNSSRIEFSASAGNMPEDIKSTFRKSPVFEVRAFFEHKGREIDINGTWIDLSHFSLSIKLFLVAKEGTIKYVPQVKVFSEVDVTGLGKIDIIPDGKVDNAIDAVIESKITELLLDKIKDISPYLCNLLVGGPHHIIDLGFEKGHIIIRYAGDIKYKDNPQNNTPKSQRGSAEGPGHLSKIKNYVVLMMENRSFDQVLGYLSLDKRKNASNPLPNSNVDGLREEHFNKWANVYAGKRYKPHRLNKVLIKTSPSHSRQSVLNQMAYGMKGFVKDFAGLEHRSETPAVVMGYYDDTQLKVYAQLADQFTVCDRWHCAIPSGTWPNRFITLSGKLNTGLNNESQFNNPPIESFVPARAKTLFDHLDEMKVSWKYFEHGYCFLRLFFKYTFDMENVIDIHDKKSGFFTAAKKGKLPQVTFIDPDFIEYPPGNDDHAPSHPYAGQKLVGEVVNALIKSPQWKDTMLIITYDEHGGFFDHKDPREDGKAPMVSGWMDEYGIRVPTFLISPWVKKGDFTNDLYDHTSIAASILRTFKKEGELLPDMGPRVNMANDIRNTITEERREDISLIKIPKYKNLPRMKQRLPKTTYKDSKKPAVDDFHELLLYVSMFGRAPKKIRK
ncbi:MAG: hypothetical protein JSR71_11620 [Proteobacteria bacterium]|nr:hypothetical protein [Pseudomonadota bacterium]